MPELQPPPDGFRWIDLSEALNAIHCQYGERYYLLPAALWEAAALWGVTPETASINACGVFLSEADTIRLRESGCKAEITLVEAPNGYWAMSACYETRLSGGGYAPSVSQCRAFPTREDARRAALCELISRFRQEAESRCRTNDEANRRATRRMIARLEAEKTPQLSLF